MAAQAGKDFLLQSDDGLGVYTTLGGLRNCSMSLNAEAIDVTNQGSSQFKELLSGAGIKHMTFSGSGVFTNSTNEGLLKTRWSAETLNNYRISNGVNTFTATMKITKLEFSGDYKGEQTYSISMESSGTITIA